MQPSGTSHIAYPCSETDPSKRLHAEHLYVPRLTNHVATLGAFILAVKSPKNLWWHGLHACLRITIAYHVSGVVRSLNPYAELVGWRENGIWNPNIPLSYEADPTRRAQKSSRKFSEE